MAKKKATMEVPDDMDPQLFDEDSNGDDGPEIPSADPELEQHKAHYYKSRSEVPLAWRRWRGVELSLPQINNMIRDARENQYEQHGSFIMDFGGARARFEMSHEIREGRWVKKGGKV